MTSIHHTVAPYLANEYRRADVEARAAHERLAEQVCRHGGTYGAITVANHQRHQATVDAATTAHLLEAMPPTVPRQAVGRVLRTLGAWLLAGPPRASQMPQQGVVKASRGVTTASGVKLGS
jgi:hypothetical protein